MTVLTPGLYTAVSAVPTTNWPWPQFTPLELACCCRKSCRGEYFHDPDFLDALGALRMRLARPLRLTSARRCALHNAEVGGAPLSQHRVAIAVDISVAGWGDEARKGLLVEARCLGFSGFGFGTDFLHLDRRQLKPPRTRPAMWDYNNGGIKKWTSCL